ncbi:MAG: GNAT family N-acetyltransferase [Verrucomicrobiota bacterium]
MIRSRYAAEGDFEWLLERDDVSPKWVRRCLGHGEYILAERLGRRLGFLRFSLFWGQLPYLEMIRVRPEDQCQGVGTAMLAFWEDEMRRRGFSSVLTSAMENEPEPQAWHRRSGFEPCGQLNLGRDQPTPELFFRKEL